MTALNREAHNPDTNPSWTPDMAWRVYACRECGQETEIQTNHTGTVWSHRCTGTCRHIIAPHTELEQVMPKLTAHVYVSEQPNPA